MSANSGCGGFYYCRQRSECVDRPLGSRNTRTHTHIIAVGALSVCGLMRIAVSSTNICPFCYRMDSWQASFTYTHGGGWPYLGTLYKHLQFTIPSSMQECPHLLTFPIHQFMLLGNQHFINAPLQVHFFVTLMDLRYESSTLILCKELSSTIFSLWVRHR